MVPEPPVAIGATKACLLPAALAMPAPAGPLQHDLRYLCLQRSSRACRGDADGSREATWHPPERSILLPDSRAAAAQKAHAPQVGHRQALQAGNGAVLHCCVGV